jgi:hypothetical protein
MPPVFQGEMSMVQQALQTSGNVIGVVKDSTGTVSRVQVNAGSLMKDPNNQSVMVADAQGLAKFVFLAEFSDKMKLAFRDNLPVAAPAPMDGPINNPPPDSTLVSNPPLSNPPPDTAKPPLFQGSLTDLQNLLNQKGWKAVMPTPQGPMGVNLDDTSLKSDGTMAVAAEVGNAAHLFVFMGDKVDPRKPAIEQASGLPMVMEKPVTAGP